MENLRRLRKNANLSQQKLADLIGDGITQPQIHSYEAGVYQPDIDTLIKIADALETTVDNIIGRATYKTAHEIVSESVLSEKEEILISRYRRLHQTNRTALFLYLDALEGK